MTPIREIQQAINLRVRLLADVAMHCQMADWSNDFAGVEQYRARAHELRFEILRLKEEKEELMTLRAEQARAVAQVCEWLGAEVREANDANNI